MSYKKYNKLEEEELISMNRFSSLQKILEDDNEAY